MDLRAADVRAACLLRAVEVLYRVSKLRRADLAQSLSQFTSSPAGNVGFGGTCVVDDLPLRQMACGQKRRGLAHRGRQREVPRSHDPHRTLAGCCIDVVEVRSRES